MSEFYWEYDIGQLPECPSKVACYAKKKNSLLYMKKIRERTVYDQKIPPILWVWYDATCHIGEKITEELYEKLYSIIKKKNKKWFKPPIQLDLIEQECKAIMKQIEEIHLTNHDKNIKEIVTTEKVIERPIIHSNNIYFCHNTNKNRDQAMVEADAVFWKGIRIRSFKMNKDKERREVPVGNFCSKHSYSLGYLCFSGGFNE